MGNQSEKPKLWETLQDKWSKFFNKNLQGKKELEDDPID